MSQAPQAVNPGKPPLPTFLVFLSLRLPCGLKAGRASTEVGPERFRILGFRV